MATDNRQFCFKVSGFENDETREKFINEIKGVKGIIFVDYNSENSMLTYIIDEWSSDYDVMTAVMNSAEHFGALFDVGDNETEIASEAKKTVGEAELLKESEENVPEEDEAEEIPDEKNEIKKKSKISDNLEKAIELSISLILLITALFLGKFEKAQLILYIISFVAAGYEVFAEGVVKLFKKQFINEEIILTLATFIVLYLGHPVDGCVVILTYSTVGFIYKLINEKNNKYLAMQKDVSEEITVSDKDETLNTDKQEETVPKEDAAEEKLRVRRAETIENAEKNLSDFQEKLNKKNKYIQYGILIAAAVIAFIPPFFTIKEYWTKFTGTYLYAGLIIACLAITGTMIKSVAVSYYCAVKYLVKKNIFVSNNNSFHKISATDTAVFDKTGVLTEGNYIVKEIISSDKEKLVSVIKKLESRFDNPFANAIKTYFNVTEENSEVENCVFSEGKGVSAVIDGKTVYAGNKKLMLSHELPFEEDTSDGTKIYVVEDKKYLGAVILSDTVKKNSRGVMLELKNDLKYSNVIFSSDCVSEVDAVKKSVGADKALAGATPQLKIEKFRQYGGNAFYVGDEMCDAKVLGKVEPSVAMNAKNNNSDFNIEDGEIRKVPEIVKISRRVKKIIRQNIFVSFGVKAVLAVLAAVLVITFDSDCFKWIFLTDTAIQILAVVNGLRNSSEIA